MTVSDRSTTGISRGSVLLAIAGILFVLLLFGTGLVRYMLRQNRLTQRQGQNRITRSLAIALADLATHKLQQDVLRDDNHQLTKNLKLPLAAMTDIDIGPSDFPLSGTPNLQPIADALIAPLQKVVTVYYKLELSCHKADFQALTADSPFPREKTGRIRLRVVTTVSRQGETPREEDFEFAIPIKVTAALIPVVSKFTLYVEKAAGTDSGYSGVDPAWRFNCLHNDVHGNLVTSPPARPITLSHTRGSAAMPKTLNDIVRAERGMVYLGGDSKIYLNLSRGWTIQGNHAEGFHLFASGRGDGLYTFRFENGCALMNWDQGIAYDVSSGGSAEWYDFVRASPAAGYARDSSIFRLYGEDNAQSPTLVLGEVFRSFLCARAFKDTASPQRFRPAFLRYVTLADWPDYINLYAADDSESIATFVQTILLGIDPNATDIARYTAYRDLASNIVCTPYNLGLAFIATQNSVAFPLSSLGGDPLVEYMSADPPPSSDKMHGIPAPFDGMVPGTATLRNMEPFIKALKVPGKRTTWRFATPGNGDILPILQAHGLAIDRKLYLDGWVYFDGETDIKVPQNLQFFTNGGIVLKKGTIHIQNEIKGVVSGSDPPPVLQMGTLDGDIKVETTQPVHAALFAHKGSVTFAGGGQANITGAVAMSRFPISNASQGAKITYTPELAALPNQTTDNLSELPALCISLDPNPIYLH